MPAQEKFDLIIRARDEATTTIRAVNSEVNKLSGTALPRLTTGLGTYERAALKADIRSAALGASIAGMPPVVTQAANAFLLLNPAVAAVSVGVGILATIIIGSINAHKDLLIFLDQHSKALETLSGSYGNAARAARELLGLRKEEKQGRLIEAELELERAQRLQKRAGEMFFTGVLSNPVGWIPDQKKNIAELTVEIGNLREAIGLMGQTLGREGPMSALEQDTAAIAKNLKEIASLNLQNIGGFGNMTTFAQVDAARQASEAMVEQQRRLAESNAFGAMGEGPMSMIWEKQEQDMKDSIDAAQSRWNEFSGVVMSSTDQLATGITDMFFGLRDNLSEVFQSMAQSWVKYFINEIIKQTALKLGFALFNIIFPGAGGVLAGAGAVASGAGNLDLLPNPRRSGLDVISAGARRFPSGGASSAGVTINIDTVIGTEEFVGKRIIPAIENAIRFQKTSIAGR